MAPGRSHVRPAADNNPLRPFFDKVCRNGTCEFKTQQDGPRFLDACLQYEDKLELLWRLTKPTEHGLKRLRTSLTASGSPEFIQARILPFLQLLGSDELCRGTCKASQAQVIEAIYKSPGVLDSLYAFLTSAVEGRAGAAITASQAAALGWFLRTLASQEDARSDPLLRQFVSPLKRCGGTAAEAARQLEVMITGARAGSEEHVAIEDLAQQAGGRHDNDHADYRSIEVMVTSEEALCRHKPYLPRPQDTELAPTPEAQQAAVLDRQFRLLREDFVDPLRQRLKELGISKPRAVEQQQDVRDQAASAQADDSKPTVAASLPPIGDRNVFPLRGVLGVETNPRPCVMVEIELPHSHRARRMNTRKEREEFWTEFGRGTLPQDALVCLASPGEQLVFALVVRRDAKELAHFFPRVGLAFQPGPGVDEFISSMGRPRNKPVVVVQVSSSYFSVKPVLECLQDMHSVPLAEELVYGEAPRPLGYLKPDVVEQELSRLGQSLDPSQHHALALALTSRVALIQGPPGTGKTYTGVELCDILVRCSSEIILCVCYTNHALDQFLEALLDKGITDIVRIGSRSKSKRLEPYNLKELIKNGKYQKSKVELRHLFELKDQIAELAGDDFKGRQGSISRLSARLLRQNTAPVEPWQERKQQQQQQHAAAEAPPAQASGGKGKHGKGQGPGSGKQGAASPAGQPAEAAQQGRQQEAPQAPEFDEWDDMGPFLRVMYSDAFEQLKVPDDFKGKGYLWKRWVWGMKDRGIIENWLPKHQKEKIMASGQWQTTTSNKRVTSNGGATSSASATASGTSKGSSGSGAGDASSTVSAAGPLGPLWRLDKKERLQLANHWRSELRMQWASKLVAALQRTDQLQLEKRRLDDGQYEAVLKRARVIGCTTTGAALVKDLLQTVVKPGIVLVEEAGELLEAHVLTSLSPSTKHLILIGDHKQLRPKVDTYALSKASGKGWDLNVSLFERLVLTPGFPHATLGVQWRMHPAIASLIRHTYPTLEDHSSVLKRASIKGVPLDTHVLFISHSEPEMQEAPAKSGMWGASQAFQSKVNMHEVEMCTSIVRYMLQQGYGPDQITVLTPYLGQLLELQKALSAEFQVLLDELDMQDIRKAALPAAWSGLSAGQGSGGGSKAGVRVATIDNYQGEECDIILVSLVRSNSDDKVGFLKEPERINVMLSRAREGLIMVGNAGTFAHASNPEAQRHWHQVFGLLAKEGQLMESFPAVCKRHGTRQELRAPKEFRECAPDGGCMMPCGEKLACGHTCTLRCHAYDHGRVRCEELVYTFCPSQHLVTRKCSEPDAACPTCVELEAMREEQRRAARKLSEEIARKRAAAEKEKLRVLGEQERLKAEMAAMEEMQAATRAAIERDLETKRLAKQMEAKYLPAQLDAMQEEARKQAEQELAALKVEAQLQAQLLQQEKELKRQQQAAERQARQLERRAAEVDSNTHKVLQGLENQKNKQLDQYEQKAAAVEARGTRAALSTYTAIMWRQAVSQAAGQGQQGVETLRQQLSQAWNESQDGASLAGTLDIVFDLSGLGNRLLSYVTAPTGDSDSMSQGAAQLRRGLGLIKDSKYVEALDYFTEQQKQLQQQQQGQADVQERGPSKAVAGAVVEAQAPDIQATIEACLALCSAKLGMGSSSSAQAAAAPRAKGRQGQAQQPASSAKDPAPLHPLQHLANAITFSQQLGSRASDYAARRQADLRCAGEALAMLLHPAVTQAVPGNLVAEAIGMLKARAPAFTSPVPSMPQHGAGSMATAGNGSSKTLPKAWQAHLQRYPSLAKLRDLTGLAAVKNQMFSLADQVELAKERQEDLKTKQFSTIFYGGPGTGKTTVARIYAELLKELGALPQAEVVETSGAELSSGGTTKLDEQLKKLEKGGVLFLDEAYQLKPSLNPMGAQVLDKLLPEIENRRGKLVVILAGYRKQMEDLLSYNEGLPSRFPSQFTFEDYSDAELLQIFKGVIDSSKPRFVLEDERFARIAARRLGRQRGSPGFGNARAVRNMWEQTKQRQSARVIQERAAGGDPDTLLVKREDMLGPKFLEVSACKALQQLQAMRGLASVKASVSTLLELIRTNAELEDQEKPLREITLNRCLLGNPGTGKTTVAKLYGQILHDLGLLSKGEVVVKNPSDFLGSVLGESEKQTNAILDATLGCVLVIDEAYGLHSKSKAVDPYKEAVIDTIVARVQGVPGDDRCVLMLGYTEQMETMMREANPGLSRRFQLSNAWRFEDYSSEDLWHIMKDAAKRQFDWDLGIPELRAGVKALERERVKPNFGNAGAVNNLLSVAAQRMELRTKHLSVQERAQLTGPAPEDLFPDEVRTKRSPESIFEDLIGCKQVLEKLREWQATIKGSQLLGKNPLESFELNFLFTGSPGTGKTTVASRVGQLFQSLGLLAGSQVFSCSASDLTTGYANQAGRKTRDKFEEALGQVLFIDEAYRLNPEIGGPYMQEVIDEIVQLLTEPRFMGKMVVILAGYEHQIERLMAVNPGLKSRFSEKLHFPDFTVEDTVQLVRQRLVREYDLTLAPDAEAALPQLAAQLIAAPGWSNGRDIGTWAKRVFRRYSLRVTGTDRQGPMPASTAPVMLQDLQDSLREFISSKGSSATTSTPQEGSQARVTSAYRPAQLQQQQQQAPVPPAPPAVSISTATRVATAPPVVQIEEEVEEQQVPPVNTADGGGGFGGLSPEFLKAMQDGLEALGYDLTSSDVVQALSTDPSLAARLLPLLASSGSPNTQLLTSYIKQWQVALQKQMEVEKELAKRKQRPVWRCAVCGRYGCPVAPYIERYEEVP